MLAFIYLGIAFYFGDRLCRRFYGFVSLPHRWAAAVLVGLLVSSWSTYLVALAFKSASDPLLWGNLFFAAAVIGFGRFFKGRPDSGENAFGLSRANGSDTLDWLV